jgi:hypothetical protein
LGRPWPGAGGPRGARREGVAVARDGDDVALVEQPVEDGGGHHRATTGPALPSKRSQPLVAACSPGRMAVRQAGVRLPADRADAGNSIPEVRQHRKKECLTATAASLDRDFQIVRLSRRSKHCPRCHAGGAARFVPCSYQGSRSIGPAPAAIIERFLYACCLDYHAESDLSRRSRVPLKLVQAIRVGSSEPGWRRIIPRWVVTPMVPAKGAKLAAIEGESARSSRPWRWPASRPRSELGHPVSLRLPPSNEGKSHVSARSETSSG